MCGGFDTTIVASTTHAPRGFRGGLTRRTVDQADTLLLAMNTALLWCGFGRTRCSSSTRAASSSEKTIFLPRTLLRRKAGMSSPPTPLSPPDVGLRRCRRRQSPPAARWCCWDAVDDLAMKFSVAEPALEYDDKCSRCVYACTGGGGSQDVRCVFSWSCTGTMYPSSSRVPAPFVWFLKRAVFRFCC